MQQHEAQVPRRGVETEQMELCRKPYVLQRPVIGTLRQVRGIAIPIRIADQRPPDERPLADKAVADDHVEIVERETVVQASQVGGEGNEQRSGRDQEFSPPGNPIADAQRRFFRRRRADRLDSRRLRLLHALMRWTNHGIRSPTRRRSGIRPRPGSPRSADRSKSPPRADCIDCRTPAYSEPLAVYQHIDAGRGSEEWIFRASLRRVAALKDRNAAKLQLDVGNLRSPVRWFESRLFIPLALATMTVAMFGEALLLPGDQVLSRPDADIASQFMYWRQFGFDELKLATLLCVTRTSSAAGHFWADFRLRCCIRRTGST